MQFIHTFYNAFSIININNTINEQSVKIKKPECKYIPVRNTHLSV